MKRNVDMNVFFFSYFILAMDGYRGLNVLTVIATAVGPGMYNDLSGKNEFAIHVNFRMKLIDILSNQDFVVHIDLPLYVLRYQLVRLDNDHVAGPLIIRRVCFHTLIR
jgi:hypothetical protein